MESIKRAVAGSAEKCVEEWCRKVATPAKIGLEPGLVEDLERSKQMILGATGMDAAPAANTAEFETYCDAILNHFRTFRTVVDGLPVARLGWRFGNDVLNEIIYEADKKFLGITLAIWNGDPRNASEEREYRLWIRRHIFKSVILRSKGEFKQASRFAELSEGVLSHNKNLRTEFEADILDRDEARMIREVVGDVVNRKLNAKGKAVTPSKLALIAAKSDASSSELAEIVGLTASGVRQIQRRTLEQLRPEIKKRLEEIDPDLAAGIEA